ncbi:dTMP kinase [Bacillus piscicola]|uniref:dTMP kinase n=1 Tax=Bacillus piscicola TaxID=1632684 RepID=UPI001F09A07C|nr:dTMP kinase [Bacillus piscicola]
MSKKGMFISFEGCEGAGKTTVIEHLYEKMVEKGYRVMKTREPGGIDISEQIRTIILHPGHKEMDSRTEALLYAAARRQHLVEKVIPALEDGCHVLCDRFIDSSLAYQGAARGIGIEDVLAVNEFAIGPYMPDGTIYIDILPETGLTRIFKNKDREINRLDNETIHFHQRVHEAYQNLQERYPERIHKINGEQSLDNVILDAERYLNSILSGE